MASRTRAAMARVSRADQINRLVAGLQSGGATVLSSSAASGRPVTLRATLSDGSLVSAVVYSWNIRHSGGARSAEERRVQMTGVQRPSLYAAPGSIPLLLGYEADEDVFRHPRPQVRPRFEHLLGAVQEHHPVAMHAAVQFITLRDLKVAELYTLSA